MQTLVVAVYPGAPTSVDAIVAGVSVRAEWVGIPPTAGEVVDVELDIDAVLGWGETIAIDGTEMTLRQGPLLRGTVEIHEQELLTVRVGEGLVTIEVDDGSKDVPAGTGIVVVAEHSKLYPTGV